MKIRVSPWESEERRGLKGKIGEGVLSNTPTGSLRSESSAFLQLQQQLDFQCLLHLFSAACLTRKYKNIPAHSFF